MKCQLVKETAINKRKLLFYRLESGLYTLWWSVQAWVGARCYVGGGRGICPAPHAGMEGERCIKTGASLR